MMSVGLTQAQKPKFMMTSAEFENNMKSKSPLGYTYGDVEIGENEYVATFQKNSDFILVRLKDLRYFSQYKTFSKTATQNSGLYQYQHCNAAYFQSMGISMLYLELFPINGSIEISAKKPLSKAEMEKIVDELDLAKWENTTHWPTEITSDNQLDGVLLSVEKKEASTEGFAYEYHVKIQYSQKLIQSVERIIAKYGGEIDLVRMGNFIFICAVADNMESLKKGFKEGESVDFIYYRKN